MKFKTATIIALPLLTFSLISCEDNHQDKKLSQEPSQNHHGAHGHEHPQKVPGPNGGKIMTAPNFKCELFITEDRTVRITFLNESNEPIAISTQEVSLTHSNSDAQPLTKSADGMYVASSAKLPEGNPTPITITVKASSDAKPARARINIELTKCPDCSYPNYACICDDHSHPHGHGDHQH